MEIIGMLDSPFVRRVAVTARLLGLEYRHRPLSIFSTYDEFRKINPLVKVPTLVCDNGETLVDSTLIIDYLESLPDSSGSLMPQDASERRIALRRVGVALVAMEKVVQLIYETRQRPPELQHVAWVERLNQQLLSAVELMEEAVGDGEHWMFGSKILQPDLSTAIAWRFVQHVVPETVHANDFTGLVRFSERAEALPEFQECPIE